jgi:hypothetical protein
MFVQPNKLSIPTLMLPLPPEVEALITHQVPLVILLDSSVQ